MPTSWIVRTSHILKCDSKDIKEMALPKTTENMVYTKYFILLVDRFYSALM